LNVILKIGFHNDGPLFPASRGGSSLAAEGGAVDPRCQADRSGTAERWRLGAVTADSSFDGPEC
jgi:hypothetical protein